MRALNNQTDSICVIFQVVQSHKKAMSYAQQPQPPAGPGAPQRSSNHSAISHRLNELLEAIKQEFASVSNEANAYMLHKDEVDHKLLSQHMSELQQVRKAIYELDMAHRQMKEQYEEEIARLRRALEQATETGTQPQLPRIGQHESLFDRFHQNQGITGQPGMAGPPMVGQHQASGQPLASKSHVAGQLASTNLPPKPKLLSVAPPQSQLPPQNHLQVSPQTAALAPAQSSAATASTVASPSANAPAPPATGLSAGPLAPSNNVSNVSGQTGSTHPSDQTAVPIVATSSTALRLSSAQGSSDSAVKSAPAPRVAPPQQNDEELAAQMGNNLASLDVDQIPAQFIKRKDNWHVIYNEKAPPLLDVDLVTSLEHSSVVCCVRFSVDGKYLATGCNRSAQIFDVQTGQLTCRLQDDSVDGDADLYIRSVCFSPDGQFLATGAEDHLIRVWDIASQKIRYIFSGHEQDIYSLDYSSSGRFIASGSGDRTVRLWDVESGQCAVTLTIEDGVTAVCFSPCGRYVAAGSLDHIVRVWDTVTGFLIERLEAPEGHRDSVYSVVFAPNGKDLLSGSLDRTIKVWELQAPRGLQSTHRGGVCVRTIYGHLDFVLSVASTPDGQWIISGSKDRTVQFWDAATGQTQLMLQAHVNSVISVAPSSKSNLFATGGGDHWAKIWRYGPRQH